MSNLNTHGVTDYASAKAVLDKAGASRVVLCYATTLTHEAAAPGQTCVTVRHHDTAIIRYWSNGLIEIRNGGYMTRTTTDRLHRMTPAAVRVWSAKGGGVESPRYSGIQPSIWMRVI